MHLRYTHYTVHLPCTQYPSSTHGYDARMATNKPQDDYQKQGVRIPRTLHERIHEAAAASGRSYNSELIARLEASFESTGNDTQESAAFLGAELALARLWNSRNRAALHLSHLHNRVMELDADIRQATAEGDTKAADHAAMLRSRAYKDMEHTTRELDRLDQKLLASEEDLARHSPQVDQDPPSAAEPKRRMILKGKDK